MCEITRLTEEQADAILTQLIELLQDSVNNGASVGFLPPLKTEAAQGFWLQTFREVSQQKRVVLIATESGEVAGAVQLELAAKENAVHRAEVQKLFVHTRFRKRGMASMLMSAIESAAREAKRTLLVLDTQQGSAAEKLYAKIGYTPAGVVPQYARDGKGELKSTVIFYKTL